MSEHKKTVTAICWHPKDSDQLATASADKEVIIWSVPEQVVIARLEKLRDIPICLGWNMQVRQECIQEVMEHSEFNKYKI